MRADAEWEAYHATMTRVMAGGKSDDELIAEINPQIQRVELNDFLRASGHLAIWLALLYVVVEGWRKWKFFDTEVDRLLESPYVEELKEYRHAIFHANEFNHKDVMQFGTEGRAHWAASLGNALRTGIRDWHEHLRDRLEQYLLRSPL